MKQKNNILSHNFTNNSLVIVYANPNVHTRIIEATNTNWQQLLKAYKAKNFDEVINLTDIGQSISKKFDGKFEVKNGKVYFKGEEVYGYIFDQILFFMKENLDYKRLLKFAENLYENESKHAREDLYKFLEIGNMPITEDGCFLGYKGVGSNYYSITQGTQKPLQSHTNDNGQIYNGIGQVVEVARKDVNEDRNACTSYGIHVGSFAYANSFKGDGRLLIVKVNPKDVVAVPIDGNKLRVVKYEVIAEEGRALDNAKDTNYVRKVKAKKLKRDSLGRFCS